MEIEHVNIIISNLAVLVNETDLSTLVPELLQRNVFNQQMIERILNPLHDPKRRKTDLYVQILKRGPQAFWHLLEALASSNHSNLANILRMESRNGVGFQRSDSLTSPSSNVPPYYSDCTSESDGPGIEKTCLGAGETAKRPISLQLPNSTLSNPQSQEHSNQMDFEDFAAGEKQTPIRDSRGKVFNLPTYGLDAGENPCNVYGELTPEGTIYYHFKENQPVRVKYATDWKSNPLGRPRMYKMDSNPRGCALIINNMHFDNKDDFPDRNGAENDEKRLEALQKQLHFTVEVHRNKTKSEILIIAENFSQKNELKSVDCLWVTIMTHGYEGKNCEESQLFGVDGLSCKTSEIVSLFYGDSCKAAIDKPKIFFFQACRGCLTDPGVLPYAKHGKLPLDARTSYDGIRIKNVPPGERKRTYSDVFIAFPTPDGIQANRDQLTGTWFIQAVVDIFSEYAKDHHFEDLLKMVDDRLKEISTLQTYNYQAVSVTAIGWSKLLYFNPGLYRDKKTNATVRFTDDSIDTPPDEGMDEVDSNSSNSNKSPTGVQYTYSRLKDDKDDNSDDRGENCSSFNTSCCRTS